MGKEKEETRLKLDRFYVNVPEECLQDFMADLVEEVRSPSELAAYIIVHHYRRKKRMALAAINSEQPEGVQSIPSYGPRPARPSEQASVNSQDEI